MYKKFIFAVLALFLAAGSLQAQKLIKNFTSVGRVTSYKGFLLFAADDGAHGIELWKSDGTNSGTTLVKDIATGPAGSSPANLTVYNGKVYFAANDGVHGNELWVSDGTPAGTKMFADINPYPGNGYNGSDPVQLTVANNRLFFVATNSSSVPTSTLFVTDGTSGNLVQLISSLNEGPGQLIAVQNTLYFTEGPYSGTLGKSDGTVAGTTTVNLEDNVSVGQLRNINGNLVFTTSTSNTQNIKLYQLSPVSDTPVLLQSYDAVQYGGVALNNITQASNGFFYSIEATDANRNGIDYLWYSDGTVKGTASLKNYPWTPYLSGSSMKNFVNFNNKLYFAAPGSFALWTSDGTATGTTQAANINLTGGTPVLSANKLFYILQGSVYALDASNSQSLQFSSPQNPTQLQDIAGTLYFSAKSGAVTGLWNNIASPQLNVAAGYQSLSSGDVFNINTKIDSAITTPVTITNAGNATLTLAEVSVSGTAFYVNGHPAQVLKSGASVNFNLVYFPAQQNEQNGTLTIRTNDNSKNDFKANLTGTIHVGKAKSSATPSGLNKAIDFTDTSAMIKLSNNKVDDDKPAQTIVGVVSLKNGQQASDYKLTTGDGDSDNSSFIMDSGKLKTAAKLHFADKNTYSIRVAAQLNNTTYQQTFVVQVNKPADTTTATGPCGAKMQNLTYGLYDVGVNGTRIVAVGGNGKILESTDNGAHWLLAGAGAVQDLKKIRFADSNTGYILGNNNTFLKSTDGGASWGLLNVPSVPYPYFTAMAFPTANTGYIFSSSAAYKTTDGGKSWLQLDFASYNNINAAFFTDEKTGYVCGSSDMLMKTTDGGLTWTTLTSTLGDNTNLQNILFVNATGYLFSTAGDMMKTTDGGKTWSRAGVVPNGYVQGGYFLSEKTGYVASGFSGSAVFETTDGGSTWNNVAYGFGDLLAVAFNKDGSLGAAVGIGVGSGASGGPGRNVFVKQGGQSWQNAIELTGDDFNNVNFTDTNTGYLFGNRANLKTTDGGISWHPMQLDLSQAYPYPYITSFFSSKNTAYCVVMADLYKTSDAGTTWKKLLSGDGPEQIRSVYFINDDIGFIGTMNDGEIKKTIDGGATWTSSPSLNPAGWFFQIQFINNTTGFAVGANSIVKTTDQGLTWTYIYSQPDSYLTAIHMFDESNGLAAGLKGLILQTSDGGKTWKTLTTAIVGDIQYLCFVNNMHGYAFSGNYGISYQSIFETFDGGLTWQSSRLYTPEGQGISLQGNAIYLSGQGGVIEKLAMDTTPGKVGNISGETVVAEKTKTDYTVAAGDGVNYKWTANSSDMQINTSGNKATVQWNKAGTYQLQVANYNGCGAGDTKTLNVTVVPAPKIPVITGPDTVLAGAHNILYQTGPDTSVTYTWFAKGDSTVNASVNTVLVNWGKPGTGSVDVVATQPATGLRAEQSLNVLINAAPFTQPNDNFRIQVTSEPCKGDNDGIIKITAVQKLNYTVIVQGSNTKTLHFTDSVSVTGLAAGSYKLAITADGKTGYERDFTVNVTEPKDLSLYAVVNQADSTVNLNLQGGNLYTINLNGTEKTTSLSQLSLKLAAGDNVLTVSTDKPCQGIIQKHLLINNNVIIFPNPFTDVINIRIGFKSSGTAKLTLQNLQGKLIWSGTQTISNNKLQINPGNLDSGFYILRLDLDNKSTAYKIWKK
ncbi:T9SS type A sorting domain-containing protein [Mucilaginibacter sp. BJC16-A38]|uniref:ELWxxDGT repeat protein n=1 Tax=Mucilaginibacter phenanthrenivorans TaxID=1234842 RepID=UPI0021581E8A|nr:ELWxxDGT repeat protein [Mucilaginibacter phenanthrenivorans]MCR8556177.1 T9SS type A sorting domain-containing protein [Mucilaginibacter phenanthrenivorans]